MKIMKIRKCGRTWVCSIAGFLLFFVGLSRYWVNYDPTASFHRNPESFSLAYNLYDKGSFANPFAVLATGPSAHLAPAFPAFLALLVKVFGNKSAGYYAIQLAAALSVALLLALFPMFSRMLGMGALNGIVGASIWILAKPAMNVGVEAFYAALLLAAACCCYRRYLDSRMQEHNRLGWLLGCLMGLSILMIPTVVLVFATWVGWEMWRIRLRFFKGFVLTFVLLPTLIITPWTIRNYSVFHRFIFLRDNLGLELDVSNNDCAQFGQSKNNVSGCFYKFHPNVNPKEAEKVLELGETKYNDLKLREALQWIRSHPAGFAKLSAMRFIAFWIPNESGKIFFWLPNANGKMLTDGSPAPAVPAPMATAADGGDRRVWERLIIYLMTFLSGAGLVMLCRRDVRSAVVLLSCLTAFPLIYYFVQFDGKYRHPILWITFLLGSLPITTLIKRIHTSLTVGHSVASSAPG